MCPVTSFKSIGQIFTQVGFMGDCVNDEFGKLQDIKDNEDEEEEKDT